MTALNELFFVFSSPSMNPDRIFVSAFHTVTFQIWSMTLICRLKFVRTKFWGQNGVNRLVALTDSSPVVYVWITWEAWPKKVMGGGLRGRAMHDFQEQWAISSCVPCKGVFVVIFLKAMCDKTVDKFSFFISGILKVSISVITLSLRPLL